MSEAAAKPQKLLTFKSGGWVLLLALVFSLLAAILVLWPAWEMGFARSPGDGKNVDTYGFDLSNLTISKSHLQAAGMPKDGVHGISANLVETVTPAEADLIASHESGPLVANSDRIVGVLIKGEARAYPLRILALHEVVNDVVGGTPVAVTYSPLCDSVIVFDRRVDGLEKPAVEFGHSGLVVASNSVFYDQRDGGKGESLWPQLALKAIAGPLAGTPMQLVSYELTTWQAWRAAHGDTRIFRGLRTRKLDYMKDDQYNVYWYSDDLQFPADPLWNIPGIRKKTPIAVDEISPGHWMARYPDMSRGGDGTTINAMIFAWYAQHAGDTDYAAVIGRK